MLGRNHEAPTHRHALLASARLYLAAGLDQSGGIMELTPRDRERQHIMQAIHWLDGAIYALDKYDYEAAQIAIQISRKHIDLAEAVQNHVHD